MKFLIIAILLIIALFVWALMRVNTIYRNEHQELQKQEDEEQMEALRTNKNKAKLWKLF